MRLGVIYCCYGNPEYIDDCLNPWIDAKKTNDILIAAVHGQFSEYHKMGIEDNDRDTQIKLKDVEWENKIDYLYIQNDYNIFIPDKYYDPVYQTEAEIRDKGLQWLLKENCDFIWLLDNDEFYTVEQINKIIDYIKNEEFITWFSIPFKNYIFDGKQWISGFCPPRIFKIKSNYLEPFNINKFYWDNDVIYKSHTSRQEISYKHFPNKSIPKNLISGGIKHLTWLHTNGKAKAAYQEKHFGIGNCSYKWNNKENILEFNYDFFKRNSIAMPEIFRD